MSAHPTTIRAAPAARARSGEAARRASGPGPGWPLARDLLWVVLVFAVCPLAALAAPTDPAGAIAAGRRIADLQADLGITIETEWSRWLGRHGLLSDVLAAIYLFGHLPATAGALIWLRVDRPASYPRARDALVLTQGVTIACNLAWPVAPPRLAEPALTVDAVAGLMGHGASGLSSILQSPYAAMPSGHVAFAVIVGAVLWTERRSVPPALAILYPAAVAAIVVATGNHYALDVVGGALVAALAWLAATARASRRVQPAG